MTRLDIPNVHTNVLDDEAGKSGKGLAGLYRF